AQLWRVNSAATDEDVVRILVRVIIYNAESEAEWSRRHGRNVDLEGCADAGAQSSHTGRRDHHAAVYQAEGRDRAHVDGAAGTHILNGVGERRRDAHEGAPHRVWCTVGDGAGGRPLHVDLCGRQAGAAEGESCDAVGHAVVVAGDLEVGAARTRTAG